MTKRREWARPLALATTWTIVAAGSVSCLADLPPPALCPPPAPTETATPCGPEAAKLPEVCAGASTPLACLPIDACDACDPNVKGCFPPPACPDAVTSSASGQRVSCARITGETDGLDRCTVCARGGCATQCDGRGPVFAYAGMAAMGGPTILYGDATAPSGSKIGLYARMRGNGSVRLLVRNKTQTIEEDTKQVDSTDFRDFFLDAAMVAPTNDLSFGVSSVGGKSTIVEIDCIVPFFLEGGP